MDSRLDGLRYVQRECDGHLHLSEGRTGKIRNSQNIQEGSYGVSIRVQGIDGHPYIVLNNKEGHLTHNVSGSDLDSQSLNRSSLLTSNNHQTSVRNINEELSFPENPYESSFKSTKKLQYSGSVSSKPERKEENSNTTSLLNFQRHPELLKPYNPGESSQSSTINQSIHSTDEVLKKDPSNLVSFYKWQSTKHSSINSTDSLKFPSRGVFLNSSTKQEDQNRSPTDNTNIISSPSENITSESFSSSSGSPYSNSSAAPVEPRKTKPDVLQFKRQDSAGPIPEGFRSRRSSCSSTTATSSQSLQKFFLDEQEDALYADNVNRHENRRYIPFVPGTGRDIDTGCIPAVDELIEKFDASVPTQRRGRSARRNRINPEDRKRARSVDSAFPFGLQENSDYLDEFSRNLGKSNEHLLRPSQICLQKSRTQNYKLPLKRQNTTGNLGTVQSPPDCVQKKTYGSLQYKKEKNNSNSSPLDETDSSVLLSTLPNRSKGSLDTKSSSSSLMLQNCKSEGETRKVSLKMQSSTQRAQATPDLLKGQRQLAQQTNEETAKQILFNYLKEGSPDNDDATKRKVNLVFEKIQTLKSRASSTVQASDPAAEIKTLSEQKNELEQKVSSLQKQLDEQMKKQENNKEESSKTKANMQDIQEQLEKSMEENLALRGRLGESERELRKHLEELFELKMEQEQYQTEIRDLQEQLSEMHDELDNAKSCVVDGEREALIEELMQLKQGVQELLMEKEEQEDLLKKRERELTALKGALKEEVSTHDQEIDRLKEQYDKDLKKVQYRLEDALKNTNDLTIQNNEANQLKTACENQVKGLLQENEELRRKIHQLEAKISELHQEINDLSEEGDKFKEKMKKAEKEKQHLAEALEKANERVKETLQASRKLENQLEDMKRNLNRVTHEHHQLTERLKDESSQKEQLRNLKNEMENERWQLDKTIEKLQKEISEHVEFSRMSTVDLQKQFDEYKEKHRREISEMQRQLNDKTIEVEKSSQIVKKLQNENRHLEENLQDHQRAHDEALTKNHLLQQTIKDLQYELDAKTHIKDDRIRQIKTMEDKMSQLEMELDEEKNNSDLLLERITRCREQIDQMRGELLQERGAKQDLECDKMSLERQNKDLKSRIAHLENSHRSNKEGLVSQMEARIAELEERLENEERDRANLQLSNRRLERKVKELMMQVDDEHLTLTDQKDQLSLRLKSMKRQVEEAEEEIDRLESSKKKLQRDLEEQIDTNDQLQTQLNAARKELSRRKSSPSKMLNDLDDDDDDVSTDGDSLYDAPSVYKFTRDDV
ncbi:cingulin-like protein 1 [Spea bombifrons]|uniref:cingulin-like protein 1 n=1 Tax=Spea bombifrons TaxID=233779 RepID=UPI002348F8C9|nr:cingulin-like protein 1 [Spea bombifrons]